MKHYNEIDNVCVNTATFTWNVICKCNIHMVKIKKGTLCNYDTKTTVFCT